MPANLPSHWLLAVLALLALAACGTPTTVPEDRFYRLSQVSAEPLPTTPIDATLIVGPVTAYDVYRDRAIAYSPADEPCSLQHHHYHFWVAPPPELVREQLADYLRQARVASAVSTESTGRTRPAARLAAHLTRFERALRKDGSVNVAVELLITVEVDDAVVLRQRYDGTTAAADDSFAATVRAADKGLARVYAMLVNDLATAISAGKT